MGHSTRPVEHHGFTRPRFCCLLWLTHVDGSDCVAPTASVVLRTSLDSLGALNAASATRGPHLHATVAVTDTSVPSGVLRGACTAPAVKDPEDKRTSAEIPIDEKKTYLWIEGLRDCTTIAATMPQTEIVCVIDREADFFKLFDAWRQDPRTELVVRADHNRCTSGDLKLFDAVKASEPQVVFSLYLKRQSARPKRSKQQARPVRPERTAKMTSRYCRIALRPPSTHPEKEPLALWIIHAVEAKPAEGEKPIEWFLLTTKEVNAPEQVRTILEWYRLRWRAQSAHADHPVRGCRSLRSAPRGTGFLRVSSDRHGKLVSPYSPPGSGSQRRR